LAEALMPMAGICSSSISGGEARVRGQEGTQADRRTEGNAASHSGEEKKGSGQQVCCSTKQGGKEILSISAARLPFRVELWDRSDQHI
jgi:hypothetical protein